MDGSHQGTKKVYGAKVTMMQLLQTDKILIMTMGIQMPVIMSMMQHSIDSGADDEDDDHG